MVAVSGVLINTTLIFATMTVEPPVSFHPRSEASVTQKKWSLNPYTVKFKLFSEHIIKKILIYIYFAGGRVSRPAKEKYPRNNKVENLRSSCAL